MATSRDRVETLSQASVLALNRRKFRHLALPTRVSELVELWCKLVNQSRYPKDNGDRTQPTSNHKRSL
ncbi:MAG: hypothetical protein HC781_14685 [Leptolyngbyaceae cyanobacterium CSU_1_4]|nr:hypothetical protein [Leptolyngbyaceae cyanobacterium CSU_1_4]